MREAARQRAPIAADRGRARRRIPFGHGAAAANVFDPASEQHTGIVLGIALASFRDATTGEDHFLVLPGRRRAAHVSHRRHAAQGRSSDIFTVVDFYESKMSEYDSNFVFVPIDKLQELRGMIDPATGIGSVTVDPDQAQARRRRRRRARQAARALSARDFTAFNTWRDKQGPLLAAVQMETAILNVLLFLIIAVAGFGILAIFFMIVVEKTRDIGILKSLGASSRGVMGIFLAYGLSLGIVGSGVGMVAGPAVRGLHQRDRRRA